MLGLRTRLRALRAISMAKEKALPTTARSIAIIMDGNGRWARRHGLPVASGHRAGTRALRRTVEACIELEVRSLAVYAFSTENWTRPKDEVDALMTILAETIERELPDLAEQGVRTRFVGRRDRVGDDLRSGDGEDRERRRRRRSASISGSHSTTAAVRSWSRPPGVCSKPESIRPSSTRRSSRPSSTRPSSPTLICSSAPPASTRISNFLLWQIAYSELAFVDKLWPEFGPADLRAALQAYTRRRRRFGGR